MSDVPKEHLQWMLTRARTALSDPLVRESYKMALAVATEGAGEGGRRKVGRPAQKALNPYAVAVIKKHPGIPARKLPAALGLPSWSEEADERRVERARQGLRGLEPYVDSIVAEKVAQFGRKTGLDKFLVSWLLDEAGDPMPLEEVLRQIDELLENLNGTAQPSDRGATPD